MQRDALDHAASRSVWGTLGRIQLRLGPTPPTPRESMNPNILPGTQKQPREVAHHRWVVFFPSSRLNDAAVLLLLVDPLGLIGSSWISAAMMSVAHFDVHSNCRPGDDSRALANAASAGSRQAYLNDSTLVAWVSGVHVGM